MTDMQLFSLAGRKIIVVGHYGSGKTEFSVSLAMLYASLSNEKLALVDLDIVNPYFRSRERREMLEGAGILVYGNHFDKEITAEMPAIGATLRAPLENESVRVIVDVGGNDSGALILNQFTKYFTDDDTTVLAVVNANRPETSTSENALAHIRAIESATGLHISGIINNTHMLTHTAPGDVIKGFELCENICNASGKELCCSCYPKEKFDTKELTGISGALFPMGLYMLPTWLM